MKAKAKPGSPVVGAARRKLAEDLKKKYDSGASIRELAEEIGRSYGFVHRILNESEVALRPPILGAARRELAADLKKKYDSGASIRELAEEIGRSYGLVHRILDESKVTFRSRGGATRRKKSESVA